MGLVRPVKGAFGGALRWPAATLDSPDQPERPAGYRAAREPWRRGDDDAPRPPHGHDDADSAVPMANYEEFHMGKYETVDSSSRRAGSAVTKMALS